MIKHTKNNMHHTIHNIHILSPKDFFLSKTLLSENLRWCIFVLCFKNFLAFLMKFKKLLHFNNDEDCCLLFYFSFFSFTYPLSFILFYANLFNFMKEIL
jgi:hypothetical protein